MEEDPKATLRVDPDEAARLRATLGAAGVSASLVMIYGPALGRRFSLDVECVIGRDPECTIAVDDPSVSRQHARVTKTATGWAIEDQQSTNGTQVNDAVIAGPHALAMGDVIKVGPTVFKFISGDNVESQFYSAIYDMTIVDGLTRIHNRRYMEEFLDREMARSRRHQRPLSFGLLDIDHFKRVNDQHGHVAGDDVLRELAGRISPVVRREQLFARYGGEEFALVMPELAAAKAWIFCERLCRLVRDSPFSAGGKPVRVTMSIGMAEFERGMDRDAFVRAADGALYRAKSDGRDRVVAHEPGTP